MLYSDFKNKIQAVIDEVPANWQARYKEQIFTDLFQDELQEALELKESAVDMIDQLVSEIQDVIDEHRNRAAVKRKATAH